MKILSNRSPMGSAAATLVLAAGLWAQPDQPPPPPMPPEVSIQVSTGSPSFLGLGVAEVDAERAAALKLGEPRGVEVTRVQKDSPADKAGLRVGDVVLEYNSAPVVGTEQFVRLVRETPVGRTAELAVSREGVRLTLTATIGSRKEHLVLRPKPDLERLRRELEGLRERMPDLPHAWMSWRSGMLGVEVESVTGQLAEFFGVQEGLLVRSVLQDSPAEKAGIKAGDVILTVDGEKVSAPREVTRAVRSKQTFPVTVMRNRQELTLSVTVDEQRPEREPRRPVRRIGAP